MYEKDEWWRLPLALAVFPFAVVYLSAMIGYHSAMLWLEENGYVRKRG